MASTATAARSTSLCKLRMLYRFHLPPASAYRRKFVAAAPPYSAGSAIRTAVTAIPQRSRYRAATSPSPPLLPFPLTTTARRPYVPPATRAAVRAVARPAFFMSQSTDTPRSALARSSSALSEGERMGSIGSHHARTATQNAAAVWRSCVRATMISDTPSLSARAREVPSRRRRGAPDGDRWTHASRHLIPRIPPRDFRQASRAAHLAAKLSAGLAWRRQYAISSGVNTRSANVGWRSSIRST